MYANLYLLQATVASAFANVSPARMVPHALPFAFGTSNTPSLCEPPYNIGVYPRKKRKQQGLYSENGKTSYRQISWSLEAARLDVIVALKFDRHLGSAAAEVPVKFQSYWESLNPNLAASRLHKVLR